MVAVMCAPVSAPCVNAMPLLSCGVQRVCAIADCRTQNASVAPTPAAEGRLGPGCHRFEALRGAREASSSSLSRVKRNVPPGPRTSPAELYTGRLPLRTGEWS